MDNPFDISYPDQADSELIELAVRGDKRALHNLIVRHQIFVFNLALKMTHHRSDAEDLTQEVFIKAITSLSRFEGKSRFRTWLYRIAVNHFINARKRKSELQFKDFESYFDSIDSMPVHDLNEAEQHELQDSIEELRIRCTAGMLMCLDREQRMIYVLGEMFKVDHQLGGEIMGLTPGNFRVRLSRVRSDLYSWMNKRCGLINASNPCRCYKKTRGYIEAGYVDPSNLQFNANHRYKVNEVSQQQATPIIEEVENLHAKLFGEHPLQEPSHNKIMEDIFNNEIIRVLFK